MRKRLRGKGLALEAGGLCHPLRLAASTGNLRQTPPHLSYHGRARLFTTMGALLSIPLLAMPSMATVGAGTWTGLRAC